jgi:hypothetical protein
LQEEQPIAVRELDPAAKHNQLTSQRGILASSRLIGLNGAINSLKTKKSSATIVADVM